MSMHSCVRPRMQEHIEKYSVTGSWKGVFWIRLKFIRDVLQLSWMLFFPHVESGICIALQII